MLHKLCIKDLFYFYTLGLQVDFSSFSIVEWSLTVNRTEDVWTDWNVDDSTRGKGVHSLQPVCIASWTDLRAMIPKNKLSFSLMLHKLCMKIFFYFTTWVFKSIFLLSAELSGPLYTGRGFLDRLERRQ